MISILALATVAVSSAVTDVVITGIGLGAGVYCASRTQKTTYMPRKAK